MPSDLRGQGGHVASTRVLVDKVGDGVDGDGGPKGQRKAVALCKGSYGLGDLVCQGSAGVRASKGPALASTASPGARMVSGR